MRTEEKDNALIGKKFGLLTVIKLLTIRSSRKERKTWLCQCECGKFTEVRDDGLKSGKTRSCGCLHSKTAKVRQHLNCYKHGKSDTNLYRRWRNMKSRCYNQNNKSYERYGGRGIQVCEEWKNDFVPFMEWALSTGYKPDLSIDRIDNEKNYEPSNCQWVDNKAQNNNRRTTRKITYKGKTQSIKEWAEELGINYGTLKSRINRSKMPPEKAFCN